jgi:DNA polymerase-3 subunit alpha
MVAGQISLFQMGGDLMGGAEGAERLPLVADFAKPARMAMEKEMLGVYLTGHPLSDSRHIIDRLSNVSTDEILHFQDNPQVKDNMEVLMVVLINRKKTQLTKTNKMMAILSVEDLCGAVEVLVFPKAYERNASVIFEDAVVVLRGRLSFSSKEEEAPKIIADRITPVEVAEEFFRKKEIKEASAPARHCPAAGGEDPAPARKQEGLM